VVGGQEPGLLGSGSGDPGGGVAGRALPDCLDFEAIWRGGGGMGGDGDCGRFNRAAIGLGEEE